VSALERAFAPVPERAAYLARPATEAALAAVAHALGAGARAVSLEGPVGLGKSLLLRLLAERLGPSFEVLHVTTGALPLADLLALALGRRARAAGRSAAPLLVSPRREVLVLPIDDAEALPPAAVRGLASLLRNARGALRLVLAVDDGAADPLAGLGRARVRVRLDQPLSLPELRSYLAARLERAGVPPALRHRLEAERERILALSGGNPARVNHLMGELASHPETEAAAPVPLAACAPPARARPVAVPRDPFGPTAGATRYQPRTTSEAHLAQIERELRAGTRAIALRGPHGIGKTTLLRVLETRLREPLQPVAIPYARLAPDDFWSFVLHQLGAPRAAAPEREVLDIARRLERVGGIVVLLVDEAASLPEESAARLAAALEAAGGALRVVLAADDDAADGRLPILPGAKLLRMEERLAPVETEAFLLGRLLHAGAASAVRRRFDARTIASLHDASGGLPVELNRLAGEIEREALEPLLAPPAPARPDPPPGATPRAAAGAAPAPLASLRPARAPAPSDWAHHALGLVPHVGLGVGIPLALLALWLWLAPLFSR
jgi:type II secretory pathway predicted ATPase ExeA